MFKALSLVYALALALCLATFTTAAPLEARASSVFLGWKGLRKGNRLQLVGSGGGELGNVLYIADGSELARNYAASGTHVCLIYADATAWQSISKVWVSQNALATYRGKMDRLYPGAVLFASHTNAGLHFDHTPWQMGIREGDLRRLGVYGDCYPLSDHRVRTGQKFDYTGLNAVWHIQGTAERGP